MRKKIRSVALIACVVAMFSPVAMPNALAKQQCSRAPSDRHGYWSWRFIDGRKCWYEGRPMLSKSSLKWRAPVSAQPKSRGEIASTPINTPRNPLDAQAQEPTDFVTFDVLWRARVEQP
jgi:hypothetical protein